MLGYFAWTLFVSASLLFLVQPMIGKMILPRLGGTPAVWNTCMVFFQAVLLVGYAYTHSLSAWPRRRQIVAQLCVLALPFLVLPFSLGDWQPPAESNPVLSVLWILLGVVGLPFFVVATSAPLLQKWFSATGHPASRDPYFLYGASNLGSMLALVLYPLAVEPLFDLQQQTFLWTVGYGMLALLIAGCGWWVWHAAPDKAFAQQAKPTPPEAPAAPTASSTAVRPAPRHGRHRPKPIAAAVTEKPAADDGFDPEQPITLWRRLRWIGLAAAPSSLMLGVTTYITTDIAAIPFFWVIPLALYLLTFILVFARWPVPWTDKPHLGVLFTQPFFVMCLVLVKVAHLAPPTWLEFLIHLLAFFTTTLVCHGELARDRPSTSHLTEFYLWMSVGGVLGGMFNALVAPMIFWFGVVEYPLALVLGCLLRPSLVGPTSFIPGDTLPHRSTLLGWALDLVIPLALALLTCICLFIQPEWISKHILLSTPVFLVLLLMARPVRFALAMGLVLAVTGYFDRRENLLFEDRSFFGFLRVQGVYDNSGRIMYHYLLHGGINHGGQYIDKHHRRLPITYFHPMSGIGQVFQKFSWPDARLPVSLVGLGAMPGGVLTAFNGYGANSEPAYGVIGLGIGTLASHAKPLQRVDFFEIDPAVKHLSLPPDGRKPWFFYLQDALDRGADLDVILGDGRLKLQEMPDKLYHILVIDAFSSDAIPVHLLTLEALQLYLQKLADGGVLIFNTTNRYVDLNPVLADLARDLNLECVYYGDFSDDDIPDKYGSDWVVLRRKNVSPDANGGPPLEQRLPLSRWKILEDTGNPAWRDAYSNLLRVMKWGN